MRRIFRAKLIFHSNLHRRLCRLFLFMALKRLFDLPESPVAEIPTHPLSVGLCITPKGGEGKPACQFYFDSWQPICYQNDGLFDSTSCMPARRRTGIKPSPFFCPQTGYVLRPTPSATAGGLSVHRQRKPVALKFDPFLWMFGIGLHIGYINTITKLNSLWLKKSKNEE